MLPSSRSFDPPRELGGFLPLRGFTIGAWVFFSLPLGQGVCSSRTRLRWRFCLLTLMGRGVVVLVLLLFFFSLCFNRKASCL